MNEPRDLEALRRAFTEKSGSRAERSESRGHARERPSPEAIWDAVSGDASSADRDELIRSLATDPELAEEWRLGAALMEEMSQRAITPSPSRSSPVAATVGPWAALAAVVLVGVALGLFFVLRPTEPPVYRSGDSGSPIEALSPDGGRCSISAELEEECVLRWSDDGAAEWRIRLLTPTLELLREETTTSPGLILDAEILELVEGDLLLWQVVSLDDDDRRTAGPTFTLEIVRGSETGSP